MKIYIASSWKNQHAVEMLTECLEQRGHEVVSFVRQAAQTEDRVRFGKLDIEEWLRSEDAAAKFKFDTDGATKSDLVIYIGPSGTDAWAEVGAAWASRVTVLGLWSKGEQAGLMRHMVAAWHNDFRHLLRVVDAISARRQPKEERPHD